MVLTILGEREELVTPDQAMDQVRNSLSLQELEEVISLRMMSNKVVHVSVVTLMFADDVC